MKNIEKEIEGICKEFKNEFGDREIVYKEIINGEVTYVKGYPPKKAGVRFMSIPHGLVEVKKIRLGFAELEVICESVK